MDRVKRFTGMAKGASAVPVRRDEDESLVLFGELYRHEKERDVNLLEPMFSVEFEAVQGDGRMFKLPSGKRDYLLPDGEKHDYDWLKTPPATPLFPSLEMEANSSQMIFQKELPILQPVRTSRFSSKPDATSASTSSGSPTSSSTKSVTPTARPSSSSSKKNLNRGAAAPSKEQDSAYRIDKRSSYTPLTNRQHNSIPAAPSTTTATTATKASKKTSGGKSQPSKAAKKDARPDKASKNVTAITTKPRSNDSSVGAKDKKVNAGTARRLSGPSAANPDNVQATAALKGRSRAATGSVPATRKDGGATDAVLKGRGRAGEKEQRPKLGSLAKK
ncbi:hypothetical protein GQ55_2G323600 [Panicum hallii var. hallii]|nr:hypothetical protein GQ55_2G323600 [Panicum hallii var. hallii]PUZ71570.1 hypothetical protein GQ55_2G323600 [Panicum hallii var. hallii]